jgi:hypothetical protein
MPNIGTTELVVIACLAAPLVAVLVWKFALRAYFTERARAPRRQ